MNLQVTDHFKLSELWSPDNYEILLDPLFWAHMELLEELRQMFGGALRVNSGHRSVAHNTKVGGAEHSMHLRIATDLAPLGYEDRVGVGIDKLYEYAKDLGFAGVGRYNTFLHVDRRDLIGRSPAEWDSR
jgi:uncharacterized protein YcbK (DUF882 family)|tara:strand:- start:103 stop:492 length:390 start_codon:yes stop_codon:yes gene_type:complete